MTARLILRSWDRPRLFELDPARGAMSRLRTGSVADSTEVSGFVKSCIGGAPLVVYRHHGSWYLQHGFRRWLLADENLRIVVRKWLFGRRIAIEAPGVHINCWISDLGQWLGKRLDPTYDHLDKSADDFPLWLAERRVEARRYDVSRK